MSVKEYKKLFAEKKSIPINARLSGVVLVLWKELLALTNKSKSKLIREGISLRYLLAKEKSEGKDLYVKIDNELVSISKLTGIQREK